MFTEIGIENFKAFGKMQRIPLKPITLLYGPNSSGKSSIMQALLLLKQTLEEAGDEKIILLPKGNLVDLGGYEEFINGHDSRKDFHLSISFRYAWQEMAWYDWIWEAEKLADPSLDFSFCQDKTGEILLKSIKIAESLHQDAIMEWKNVWNIPYLKRAILKRKAEFEKGGDAPEVLDRWMSDLKKSVLVMDHMNLAHFLVRHYWDGYDVTRHIRVKTLEETRERYTESDARNKMQNELVILRNNIKKKTEKIKIESDKLVSTGSELKAEDLEELKNKLVILRAELKQMKQVLRISKIIHQSLIDSSFDDFLKIKYFPASGRLISVSNCFPHDEIDLNGSESLLFKTIPEFVALGTGEKEKSDIYDTLSHVSKLLPYASAIFKEYLRRIVYIGPLREYPERVYSYSGNIPSNVGKSGRYTPDILMKNPDLVNKINQWFDSDRFDIGYSLQVDVLKRNLFSLSLVDKKTGVDVSPKDVGFGIGQLLPILVQGVLSENKILFIEQPEIHVHPRLQAELGSFFSEMAGRHENPDVFEEWGNQFIIETHSEHLILRLLRLIRDTTNGELKEGEKPLRPEDVAVIYAKPTEHGTELIELRISEDGDFIDKWPEGFFTERAKELF
ncbi:MAG: DUF3696 domain-containing protein [Smithella sp.]